MLPTLWASLETKGRVWLVTKWANFLECWLSGSTTTAETGECFCLFSSYHWCLWLLVLDWWSYSPKQRVPRPESSPHPSTDPTATPSSSEWTTQIIITHFHHLSKISFLYMYYNDSINYTLWLFFSSKFFWKSCKDINIVLVIYLNTRSLY